MPDSNSSSSRAIDHCANHTPPPKERPPSVTTWLTASAGMLGFVGTFFLLLWCGPFSDRATPAMWLLVGIAVSIFGIDMVVNHVHLRPSTNLDFNHWRPDPIRVAVKYAGFFGTIGTIAAAYDLFPEYHGGFYEIYFNAIRAIVPISVSISLLYIYVVDGFMIYPRDGYWHAGVFFLLQWQRIDRSALWQHSLGWLVKGFFLPLMFTYLCDDLSNFLNKDALKISDFKSFYDLSYDILFFVDVSFVCAGYVFSSLRITDTHVRSTEPTMLGWVVALICYAPFSPLID